MSHSLSRRSVLRVAAATAASGALAAGSAVPASATADTRRGGSPFGPLDAKIRAGMKAYAIPGVAVGVLHRGREYLRGYGVSNVDYPVPVDGDTVFRVASNTKPFTGTAVMRLVEQGRLDLDATVRTYLPDFRTSDESVASRVTLRQLLNHSAGWLGDYILDTGQGDDALARYVAEFVHIPQLTPVGEVFSYNNAAIGVAGRVIEVVTGKPYETAVRELLIDPLGLGHSRFFSDEIIGFNVAAPHNVVDGKAVVEPSFHRIPRSLNPAGGLMSSARDMLRWARFHLGDGTVPGDGTRLLTRRSLEHMRSRPGPGGTVFVELDGMGVTWMLRPTAQGVRVVQHGGDLAGQHSGFLMVPDRDFAMVMLTNSEGGPALVSEFFVDDWALRRYAGVSNLPAVPRALSPAELAPYEGRYLYPYANPDGTTGELELTIVGVDGVLVLRVGDVEVGRLAFYRRDYVVLLDEQGNPTPGRSDFVRAADGSVAWLRLSARLIRHAMEQGTRTMSDAAAVAPAVPPTAMLRRA
ncbi:MAG TPA: serine hydrolase domain-containing protein [Actinoplanes sp.]|jgi:CubicO group peptidase (beta-lactamase class C family)